MTTAVLDGPAALVRRDPDEVRAEVDGAVSRMFRAAALEHDRDPYHVSISCIGGCRRRMAYQLAETPTSDTPDPGESRASVLGTWIHEKLLPRLADELGGDVEVPTKLKAGGLVVPGTLDHRAMTVLSGGRMVWQVNDLKTVADRKLHGLRRQGDPFADHQVQVDGYALAEYQQGREVDTVSWVYLHRDRGDTETVVRPFTRGSVLRVVDRVTEIRNYATTDPDKAPRDGYGPGKSPACDGCPWLRRCWGDRAVAGQIGAQKILTEDVAGVETALLALDEASARRAEATRVYEYNRDVLKGRPPGEYGSMSLRYSRSGNILARPVTMLSKPMREEIREVEDSWKIPDDDGDTL